MNLERVNTLIQAHATARLEEGPLVEQWIWAVRRLYNKGLSVSIKQTTKSVDGEDETQIAVTISITLVDATADAVQLTDERLRSMLQQADKQESVDFTFEGETLPSERTDVDDGSLLDEIEEDEAIVDDVIASRRVAAA